MSNSKMPAPSTQPQSQSQQSQQQQSSSTAKPPAPVNHTTPGRVKPEAVMVSSSPSKPLPSPSKVVFPPLPPSTPVGNWILTSHSFAPQRDYFMRFCAGLARRRVVDHLMWFRFPARGIGKRDMVPIHYSRLLWVGGALAELTAKPGPKPLAKATSSEPAGTDPEKDSADKDQQDSAVSADPDTGTDEQGVVEVEGADTGENGNAADKPDKPDDDSKKNDEDEDMTAAPASDENSADAEKDGKPTTDEPSSKEPDSMDTDKPVTKDSPPSEKSQPPEPAPKSLVVSVDEIEDDDFPTYVRQEPVDLPESYTPRVFNIVAKFLYCEEICFNYLTFDEIVSLATAAHDYGLTDLYNATFAYVMDQNLLAGGQGIRTFTPLVKHEETPESFRRYFCIAVGHHFDVLYNRLRAESATEKSLGKNTRPALWDVIFSQRMLSHVIHCIRLYSKNSYDEYLLDVVLRYFEPQDQKEDDDIIGLLSQLNWDNIDPNSIFHKDGLSSMWSPRAIRLAALASYSPQTESLEVRIPWNIPLQKLLKSDTWSFQTEHVFCGPYICYLHVRKGNSAEVSLFVHIWNRDGKPIGDDARHESVRVMCRATEMNCKCDSGKQWSDTMHGFLENLKFEGKLERYPGLGWSQFLEARRLDEWRSCHGEDCGLAITTVLQFLRPRRQFEGPARQRGSSGRSNSPTRLASPIQKKRPGLKMKLRESR